MQLLQMHFDPLNTSDLVIKMGNQMLSLRYHFCGRESTQNEMLQCLCLGGGDGDTLDLFILLFASLLNSKRVEQVP